MKFVLRIDVDKPYGNHSLIRKVVSKFIEETNLNLKTPHYLDYITWGLKNLKEKNIKAIFYFRNCTCPSKDMIQTLHSHGHEIGFHAEDTSSFVSFKTELEKFKKNTGLKKIHSFTKHGSGVHKLGKNHYPKYEPEKYKEWARKVDVPFFFGNGMIDIEGNNSDSTYYENCFWVEPDYRMKNLSRVEDIHHLQDEVVPILMHFENLIRELSIQEEFNNLFLFSSERKIDWVLA